MDQLRFDGRSVIVTGAGRGVGRCHALEFAARGASVVVADLGGALDGSGSSSGPADEVVAEITAAGGRAIACYASVAEEAGAASIVQAAVDAFGRVDVVVNNAGIANPDWFEDHPLDRFRRMIDVHYLGSVYVVHAAWPHMVKAGYGRIVNTTSEAVVGNVPKATSYGGAKGGVLGFTKALANEGLRYGIRVNAVLPRASTRLSAPEVLAKTYDVPVELFAGGESMHRFVPEQVTPAAIYLGHESCVFNGDLLTAGGGQVFRVALVANAGITKEEGVTAEDIAAGIDVLRDMSAPQEYVTETAMSDATRAERERQAQEAASS